MIGQNRENLLSIQTLLAIGNAGYMNGNSKLMTLVSRQLRKQQYEGPIIGSTITSEMYSTYIAVQRRR